MMRTKRAFTIIELSLSMTFISILLISIALTVIQMAGSYNKGLIVKYVTNAGIDISSELGRSISSSTAFSPTSGGSQYYNDTYGGRLCLGNYSYIWNYGRYLTDGNANKDTSGNQITGFIKVADSTAYYCTKSGSSYPNVDLTNSVNLLSASSGDRNIVIHSFAISSSNSAYDAASGSRLYTVSFQIGTNNTSAINFTSDPYICLSSGSTADLNYCQVQKFTFTAVSGGLYKQ